MGETSFCPLCGAEYREGFDLCADCGVPLVEAPPQESESPAPREVRQAIGLIFVGMLLTIVASLISAVGSPELTSLGRASIVALLVIRTGLAVAIGARQRWAYFCFVVAVGLGLGVLPAAVEAGPLVLLLVLSGTAANVAALLLLTKDSVQAWFREPRHSPPPPLPAGWHPDPTDRHSNRFWDGTAWTQHVADNGVIAEDPIDARGLSSEAAYRASAGHKDDGPAAVDAQP